MSGHSPCGVHEYREPTRACTICARVIEEFGGVKPERIVHKKNGKPARGRPKLASLHELRVGAIIGRWTLVIEHRREHAHGNYIANVRWECRCVCGHVRSVSAGSLRRGTSSGCPHKSCRNRFMRESGHRKLATFVGGA